ncbi:uncharacterized protein LOC110458595 [Mizuhopecten yessoensis]|nr:uncharacterized protein LOC110458595 [Mizuhopecten yessoensis]
MAPVSLKYVVSFTSQDNNYPVQNLISNDGFKKWLSNPKEKSGQIEAVFQLEQSCKISYIDIGLIWCAMLEIQVGRSDWPVGQDYQTLLHTASIMSPGDCRGNINTVRTRMFGIEHFNEVVAKETWDRIRVICRQPWRKDVQYGISFIKIKTNTTATGEDQQGRPLQSMTHKSAKSIQKHFFGKKSPGDNKDELVSRLLKIAGSSEDGTEKTESLSRTAKLVIAAKDTAMKTMCPTAQSVSPSNRQALYSGSLVSKYGPKLEEEIADFLASYEINPKDLDKITIADIRHKFEKTKKRKLTPEEKKIFIELAREYICLMFAEGDINKHTPLQLKEVDKKQVNSAVKHDKSQVHAKKSILTDAKGNHPEKCKTTPKGVKSSTDKNKTLENSPPKHTPSKPGKASCISEQKKNEVKNAAFEFKKNGFSSPRTNRMSMDSEKEIADDNERLKVKLVSNFGPSFTHKSPKGPNKQKTINSYHPSSPSTNNTWLSATSPTSTPPVSPGAQGRKRSLSGAGPRAKIPRTEEEVYTPTQGRKAGHCRGRGKRGSANSREITPTSFERCAVCHESVPEDQVVSHTLVCRGSDLDFCDTPHYQGESSGKDGSQSNQEGFPGMGNILGNGIEMTSPMSGLYPDVYIPSNRGPSVSEFSDQYVECPLCNEFFRQCVVERHAATCGT